jgi:hypothetical protein
MDRWCLNCDFYEGQVEDAIGAGLLLHQTSPAQADGGIPLALTTRSVVPARRWSHSCRTLACADRYACLQGPYTSHLRAAGVRRASLPGAGNRRCGMGPTGSVTVMACMPAADAVRRISAFGHKARSRRQAAHTLRRFQWNRTGISLPLPAR